jgi:hypothetical protein
MTNNVPGVALYVIMGMATGLCQVLGCMRKQFQKFVHLCMKNYLPDAVATKNRTTAASPTK